MPSAGRDCTEFSDSDLGRATTIKEQQVQVAHAVKQSVKRSIHVTLISVVTLVSLPGRRVMSGEVTSDIVLPQSPCPES
jgi:hypothetical protein